MPLKAWNVKSDDFERREQWLEYMEGWDDAISATSTDYAPWYVIPANEKWARNAAVAEVLNAALKEMDPQYPSNAFKAWRLVRRLKKEYTKAGLIGGKRRLLKRET